MWAANQQQHHVLTVLSLHSPRGAESGETATATHPHRRPVWDRGLINKQVQLRGGGGEGCCASGKRRLGDQGLLGPVPIPGSESGPPFPVL